MSAKNVKVGDFVTFVDASGAENRATVTAIAHTGSNPPKLHLTLVGKYSSSHESVTHYDNKAENGEYWKI